MPGTLLYHTSYCVSHMVHLELLVPFTRQCELLLKLYTLGHETVVRLREPILVQRHEGTVLEAGRH